MNWMIAMVECVYNGYGFLDHAAEILFFANAERCSNATQRNATKRTVQFVFLA